MPMALVQHAPDTDRTRANTWREINERLDHETELRLRSAATQDRGALTERIEELEREWDFDRIIEAEAAIMGVSGLILGVMVDRRFTAIPALVTSMMLLHSTQGWYPLLPLLRRMGVRTEDEIERERYALKALRGDFAPVGSAETDARAEAAWRAVLA
jgi:hypothetical protein